LTDSGLIIEKVDGMNSELFIKVAAPLEVIGHAAEKLMLRKPTHIGENHLYIGMTICTMFYYLI
jgi:hypothetical protein